MHALESEIGGPLPERTATGFARGERTRFTTGRVRRPIGITAVIKETRRKDRARMGRASDNQIPFGRRSHYEMSLMIKAVIFDLDSCLAAADEVGGELFAPAFRAIRAANQGKIPEDQLQAAFADCWRFPFDFIAGKYGFSPEMRRAGFEAFSKTEVHQPMYGYGDLSVLADIPAKLFLVTSGFRRLQESKVKALKIAPLFTEIYIDAIDEARPTGKLPAFEAIVTKFRLCPAEVWVVGDNPDSEIAAGNQLGMVTIQILRPGVPASPAATYRIQSLYELKATMAAPLGPAAP